MLFQVEPIKFAEGKWACPYCSKLMNEKWLMARHIKIHTGEKPYACKYCSYRCIQLGQFKRHVEKKHQAELLLE